MRAGSGRRSSRRRATTRADTDSVVVGPLQQEPRRSSAWWHGASCLVKVVPVASWTTPPRRIPRWLRASTPPQNGEVRWALRSAVTAPRKVCRRTAPGLGLLLTGAGSAAARLRPRTGAVPVVDTLRAPEAGGARERHR